MRHSWDSSLLRSRACADDRVDRAALICVPSPGNGDLQFDRWPDVIGDWHTCHLRLPLEGAPSGFPAQAAHLVSSLCESLTGEFALFGHESAALLAYEMAVELQRRGATPPSRLFVSGSPGPQHARPTPPRTEDDLAARVLSAVVTINGNPLPTVIADGVRSLRTEEAALADYQPADPDRLPGPITVISWAGQDLGERGVTGWAACGDTELVRLPGHRLCYAADPAELLTVIRDHPPATLSPSP